MDPNKALERIREIVNESARTGELPDDDQTETLLELVESLDSWLTHSGFLPKAWSRWSR